MSIDAASTFSSDFDFFLAFCFDLALGHLRLGIDNISISSRQLSLHKVWGTLGCPFDGSGPSHNLHICLNFVTNECNSIKDTNAVVFLVSFF